MTTEELFYAAVNVIKSLPKNGSYQPSHQLMLKFYGFYKQATEGPCDLPKPAFWDVVGKAKWDAWNKLGDMPKEEAMNLYVEELKKIVETMSYTEKVEKFMDVLGPFYEMIDFGDKLSEPEIPHNGHKEHDDDEDDGNADVSTASQNQLLTNGGATPTDDIAVGETEIHSKQNGHVMIVTKDGFAEKYYSDSDSENDEFSDPVELQVEDIKILKKGIPDHNDNDSGFVDQVEHALTRCAQNGGDRILVEDGPNQLWAFFPNGTTGGSDHSSPEHRLVNGGLINGHSDYPSNYVADRSLVEVKRMVARGGGDEDGAGGGAAGGPAGQRRGSQAQDNARNRGVRDSLNQPDPSLSGRTGPVSGLGGSGRGGPGPNVMPRSDISEQIAMALLRLQRDMDNVLARLNVLETVALAQHNTAHERLAAQYGLSGEVVTRRECGPSWWPFRDVSFRTFVFFLTWPVVLQIVLKILSSRRARGFCFNLRKLFKSSRRQAIAAASSSIVLASDLSR